MAGQFMTVVVSLGAATSFETPEIMAISDETLDEFYAVEPALERYRRYLTDLRRRKAHVLSAQEEKLLAAAGEMSQTPETIYSTFGNADLKYPNVTDAQGNSLPLSQSTFITYQESADRILRENA